MCLQQVSHVDSSKLCQNVLKVYRDFREYNYCFDASVQTLVCNVSLLAANLSSVSNLIFFLIFNIDI